VSIEWAMKPIADAARVVYRRERCHRDGIELAELVQVGAERVLRYLGDRPDEPRTLAFVGAKQGMEEFVRHWRGQPRDCRTKRGRPLMLQYYEPESDDALPHTWHRSIPAPPVEMLIDCYRALLSMRLKDAVAWHCHYWLEETITGSPLAAEFGCSWELVRFFAYRARDRMREVAAP
jgi:hypothetical protein